MDLQVTTTAIGPDLTLWIALIIYKVTIHMICNITTKQQLTTIYNLIILLWYCAIY